MSQKNVDEILNLISNSSNQEQVRCRLTFQKPQVPRIWLLDILAFTVRKSIEMLLHGSELIKLRQNGGKLRRFYHLKSDWLSIAYESPSIPSCYLPLRTGVIQRFVKIANLDMLNDAFYSGHSSYSGNSIWLQYGHLQYLREENWVCQQVPWRSLLFAGTQEWKNN